MDWLWIPDYPELFGNDSLYYGLFEDDKSKREKTRNGKENWWWLRSATYIHNFGRVFGDGTSSGYTASSRGGVVIGFCL